MFYLFSFNKNNSHKQSKNLNYTHFNSIKQI